MVKINIAGKEYQVKFTIGFWRRVNEELGIDNRNFDTKISEDFAGMAPKVLLAGIVGENKPTIKEIEDGLDRSIMDVFEEAMIEGMTKAEKKLVEAVRARQDRALADVVNGESNEGKK